MFTGNPIGQNPAYMPNSQVVIPQITIPQGLQSMISQQQPPPQPVVQITVKGKEVAKKYVLPPNSRCAMFDEDAPLFYYKETDESGNEIAFKTCRYEEVEDPPEPEYLTVKEFRSALSDLVKELKEEFSDEQFVRSKAGKRQADAEIAG